MASLIAALAARFPVVQRLVGEEFFRAMARAYVVEEPPRSPVLIEYGDTFPGFIENFTPAAAIGYLADVARLELARGRAYHAGDAMPIDAGILASLVPENLDGLRLALHPSVFILESRLYAVTAWKWKLGTARAPPTMVLIDRLQARRRPPASRGAFPPRRSMIPFAKSPTCICGSRAVNSSGSEAIGENNGGWGSMAVVG
jgi:putative DNA-binding protein